MNKTFAGLLIFLCLIAPQVSGRPMSPSLNGIGTGSPLVIEASTGGSVEYFILKGMQLLADGTPIIVDGPCESACTLLIDVARKNVCLTTNAILMYHRAALRDTDGKIVSTFPLNYEAPGLNDYLKSRGGLPEPDAANLLMVPFEQAKQFYKPCPGAS